MKIINIKQPVKEMELYILGDTHYPRGKRKKFLQVLGEIESNPNGYMLGLGDWCECINATDPRYSPEEMAEIIAKYASPLNMMDEQWSMFESDIQPITNKIIGTHAGNHESQFTRRHGHNELKNICKRNDVVKKKCWYFFSILLLPFFAEGHSNFLMKKVHNLIEKLDSLLLDRLPRLRKNAVLCSVVLKK